MIIEVTGKMFWSPRVQEWCKLPYPGHPHGCPNVGKKDGCPGRTPLVDQVVMLTEKHWFVTVKFDLASHIQRMLKLNPHWSDRQARCCLYWQGHLRKELEEIASCQSQLNPGTKYTLCPEGMGVNVIRTAHALGIPIKTKPTDTVYKVALVYYPLEEE